VRPKRLVSGPTFLQGFLRMHDVDGGASIYVMPLRDLCSLSTRVTAVAMQVHFRLQSRQTEALACP
jgi:hypothetical protein